MGITQLSNLSKLTAASVLICLNFYSLEASAQTEIDGAFHTSAYVGGQIGYGFVDYGNSAKNAFAAFPLSQTDEDGVAGRAYLGYQFTPNLGIEAGYALFSDNVYKGTVSNVVSTKYRLETDAIDVLAVLRTPFFPLGQSGPSLSLKAGGAYVMSKGSFSTHFASPQFADTSGSVTHNNWEPEAGLSFGYKLENNTVLDVSYSHIFGRSHNKSPEIDFVALGLTYKFV